MLIAPTLFTFEVVSTIRRSVHLHAISPEDGEAALREFQRIKVRLYHNRALLRRAWEIAKQFNRPRTYDTSYIALAELRQVDLWTADEKLYNAVHDQLPYVRWIGNP